MNLLHLINKKNLTFNNQRLLHFKNLKLHKNFLTKIRKGINQNQKATKMNFQHLNFKNLFLFNSLKQMNKKKRFKKN